MKFGMKSYILVLVVIVSLSFSACGGGASGAPPPPPITYTIGGTVSGLSGTALVLQNNGGNNLPVSTNGAFAFTTSITSGGTYNVTVLTPPSNPAVLRGDQWQRNGQREFHVRSGRVRRRMDLDEWRQCRHQQGTYGT